ncbi:MAG: prolyl oligopeptidase family serine peptidase [Pirellulales bacterium]|nr:prolyl oligopeptidase family serine peptidase [Pirellulales bacterium]
MKTRIVSFLSVFLATFLLVTATAGLAQDQRRAASAESVRIKDKTSAQDITYPKARRSDHTDDYHGTIVPDPYRWLEEPRSQETLNWIRAQVELATGYLGSLPEREPIEKRLTELWNFERFGVPSEKGGRYFYTRNDGLQNQDVLYMADSLEAEPRMILDPNTFSEDGTVSLADIEVSDDGRLMAYATSTGGSDWRDIMVRDLNTGEDLEDHVQWAKFTALSWTPNGEGFFYSRYDEPQGGGELEDVNYFQKLYYHKIGTPQSEDQLVYERSDQKTWGYRGEVSEDGKYLAITVTKGTERENGFFYKELSSAGSEVVELLNDFDAEYVFLGNDGPTFWFSTDLDAPKGRIIAINVNQPERNAWKELVTESDNSLQGVGVIGKKFVASYMVDAKTQIQLFELDGSPAGEIVLPGIGAVSGLTGSAEDMETFYSFTSYVDPGTIYRYDFETGESNVFKQPQVLYDPDQFTTQQVFYESKDGTRIPMFISYKKGLSLNGENPTLLYGYGGFNISITPRYSVQNVVFMERGGVFAVANLRGGGEYGKAWHDAGRLHNKQNVFDDFIAAGEWLIENNYTRKEKLAINGGSNGGLLVGACITQRPDLFAAAIPAVGVMDMLRFQKFTIGWAWVSDYGSSDNPDDFKTQYAYSPYHNIKQGTEYPPTLITTADHDDRVVPAHSYKFAAQMQYAQAGKNPIIIRIETSAGHGAGTPVSKRIEQATDALAFLNYHLQGKEPAPASFQSDSGMEQRSRVEGDEK